MTKSTMLLHAKLLRICLITAIVCCISPSVTAQQISPDPNYKLVMGSNIVQDKNYYLLTLFDELKDVHSLLEKDTILSSISKQKSALLSGALKDCNKDGSCFINRMKFSNEEITSIKIRLAELYTPGNALDKLIKLHLLPSGTYFLYQELDPKSLLSKAWELEAGAINYAIDVYAAGRKPNYPLIDSISLDVKDPVNRESYRASYINLLYNTASLLSIENQQRPNFYSIPLMASLRFFEMNERNQISDFEPMEKGENKPACDRIKKINWSNYKYSAILIPGAGPDDPDMPLSAEGMLRCRLAAVQYKQGLAPFLIPSGGAVHPYKTKFNEAIEMKKFLVNTLGIPENAIIIEPHARHTTTNMRNGVRLMYRYGLPMDKPALATTTQGQLTMVGTTLIERCQKELNIVPYKPGRRLSETSIEFFPLAAALQLDFDEPLDP